MSRYICTSICSEEKYNLATAIDYMIAIKLLKEAGNDISNMFTFFFDQSHIDLLDSILINLQASEFKYSDDYQILTVIIDTDPDTAKEVEKIVQKEFDEIDTSLMSFIKIEYKKGALYITQETENFYAYGINLYTLANLVIKINKKLNSNQKIVL